MAQTHSTALEKPRLTLGFIPLTDCAPLVVAQEMGLFARHGLEVTLSKETSWANIRDKLAIGVLDGAHLLAPMALASHLAPTAIDKPLITALSLGLNGNAITLSTELFRRLREIDPTVVDPAAASARPLKRLIEERKSKGEPLLTLATVFPFSSHNYLLRYWLAAGGIDPEREVKLIVIPPAQMVSQLRQGAVDGFCVGEPWNSLAVREDLGRVICTSQAIWHNHPEKVLGVGEDWAEQHPHTHRALISALLEAQHWLDEPANRLEAVNLLASGVYVNAPAEVIRMSMLGTFQFAHNEFPRGRADFNLFHRHAAHFPWRSHAVWFMTQMVRWGQVAHPFDIQAVAERVYRPDLQRQAAAELGMALPEGDYKTEGFHEAPWTLPQAGAPLRLGADRFADGGHFDPHDPLGYLAGFAITHPALDLDPLRGPWAMKTDIPNRRSAL